MLVEVCSWKQLYMTSHLSYLLTPENSLALAVKDKNICSPHLTMLWSRLNNKIRNVLSTIQNVMQMFESLHKRGLNTKASVSCFNRLWANQINMGTVVYPGGKDMDSTMIEPYKQLLNLMEIHIIVIESRSQNRDSWPAVLKVVPGPTASAPTEN